MPGRPPTPIGIKRALGNPGKRRLKTEPNFRRLMPELAPWLDAAAKDFLERHLPMLMRAGVVTENDGPALSMLADRFSEVLALRALVKAEGMSQAIALGHLNALRRCEDAFRRWANDFGFTAVSRTRLAQDEDGKDEDADELDRLG
jgi:phage terminase small subunit